MKEISLGLAVCLLSLFRDAALLGAGQFCADIHLASAQRTT